MHMKRRINRIIIPILVLVILILFFVVPLFNGRTAYSILTYKDVYYASLSAERQAVYDKLIVKDVKITERKTGTPNFNTSTGQSVDDGSVLSNLEGKDVSEKDDYVRTFDTVGYTIEVSIDKNPNANIPAETILKGGAIKVKATIPKGTNGEIYGVWKKDSWMDSNYSSTEDSTVITATYIIPETESLVGGSQELSFNLRINGIQHELLSDEQKVKFEVWMEGNQPDNSSSSIMSTKITDSQLYISGKEYLSFMLRRGNINYKDELNGVEGQYINFEFIGDMTNEDGISEQKGSAFPTTDRLLSDIKLEYYYKDVSNGTWVLVTEDTPNSNGALNNAELIAINYTYIENEKAKPFSSSNHAYSQYPDCYTDDISVYPTPGTTEGKLLDDNLQIKVSDYGVKNTKADNVTYSQHYTLPLNLTFMTIGIELFVPLYNNGATDYDYKVVVSINDVETSNSTTEIEIDKEKQISNNSLIISFMEYTGDNISISYEYRDYAKDDLLFQIDRTTVGNYYGSLNTSITGNNGFYYGGEKRLITWEAKYFEPTGSSYSSSGAQYANGASFKYGIYNKDPINGLENLEEVNSAIEEDFTWYTSFYEAKNNGKITAILIDEPEWYGYSMISSKNIQFKTPNDTSLIDKVGYFRQKVYLYKDAERTIVETFHADNTEDSYAPKIYEGDNLVTDDTPYYAGHSIKVYGQRATSTLYTKNSNGEYVDNKTKFDVSEGIINFKIKTIFTPEKYEDNTITKTNLNVIIKIPEFLNFIESSSSLTPNYVRKSSNGFTYIEWTLKDVMVGDELDEIYFQAEINPFTENNASNYTAVFVCDGTGTISSSYDYDGTQYTYTYYSYNSYKYSISNLSGASTRKTIEKNYLEIDEPILIKNTFYNVSDSQLENVKMIEALPKNGDSYGSNYSGNYTLKITSMDENQKLYYTTSEQELAGISNDENGNLTAQSIDFANNPHWIEVTVDGVVPSNATFIGGTIGNMENNTAKEFGYEFIPSGNKSYDKYAFRNFMTSSSLTNVISSYILEPQVGNRIISGIMFVDRNRNNIKDSGEVFEGFEVTLLDQNKNVIKTTTTDTNGYYEFNNLTKQDYYVQVRTSNNYEIVEKNAGILSNSSMLNSTGITDVITELNTEIRELVTEADNINVGIKPKEATLTVHHYIEGTTTSLAQSSTSTLLWGDEYTTSEASVDSNYELVETPSNASGTMAGDTIVIYYYKLKTATITVHHYIKGTTDKLADDVVTTQKYTTTYSTKAASVDTNYELVETPSNASGTVSGNVTVTYYYQLKTATLTVNHYVQGTTTKLSDTVTKTMNWGEEYTTSIATDISENYELVSTPSNSSGTIAGDVTVNYYYKLKEGTLTIHYYVKGTTTKLSNSITKSVHWGDKYETSPATDINENYELVSTPSNATGTISANETIVIYYYQLKTATLTVNYYIEGTTTKLSNTLTKTMNWGETYTTSSASDISENYKLVNTPTNSTGTIKGDVTVNYYYRLKEAKVTVNYYIEGTTTKLADSIIQELNWGDEYETSPSPDVSNNYELVSTPSNATGTIKDDAIVVNYYYRLKEAKLTVHHYIEGTTEKLTDSETSTIYWGDQYTTEQSAKVSSNYEIVSIPSNATGTVSGDVTVIYYYRLKTATITVYHYIEGTTTRIADSVSFTKKYTEEYTTNPATDIDSNYELAGNPSNANGTVSGNVTVIYYYKLKTATLTVHHYIEGTTTSLIADEISTVTYTHTYQTSQLKENNILKNYELASTQGTLQGTVSGNIEVTYYYKLKSSTLVVKHLEYGTNKELAQEERKTLKYTDEYETSVSTSVPGNYEYYSKTDNYKGIVATDNIEVIYYYQEKDSRLSTTITIKAPEEITTKTQKVNYKLEYTSTINDYRGSGTTTIIVQLPYHIDENKSNLNGGTYNSDLKTITWITTEEDINATSEQKVISGNKDFSVTFSDLVSTDKTMNTSVTSNIKLENNEKNAADNQTTYIKIQGKIIVHHYIEGTTTKVVDDIETTNLVGETYVSESVEKKGYLLKKEPANQNHIYQDETQEIIYEYERLKFNIITKVEGGEGNIKGDETVFYGDNSTEGNIVIKPNKGYQVSHIIVNGEEKSIEECKNGCILNNFIEVYEDKEIIVIFEALPNNPETSSIITITSVIGLTVLSTGAYILVKKYKPSIKKI